MRGYEIAPREEAEALASIVQIERDFFPHATPELAAMRLRQAVILHDRDGRHQTVTIEVEHSSAGWILPYVLEQRLAGEPPSGA